MKKIAFLLALLIIIGTLVFISVRNSASPEAVGTGDVPGDALPVLPARDVPTGTKITTESRFGEAIEVNNVLRDADSVGSDTFIFAGTLDEATPRFVLTYFEEYDSFLVSLEARPLHQVRLEAEAELKRALGVPDIVICTLNISVRTRGAVDMNYAGKELGLSFCQGSLVLPGVSQSQ